MVFPAIIRGKYVRAMDDDEFFYFCQENDELRIERLPNREILVRDLNPPYTSSQNCEISRQLTEWSSASKPGSNVGSNTGFFLKNSAMRSPSEAWVSNDRLKSVSRSDYEKFPHLCPDFIIELKSRFNSLEQLKEKMSEWMENGCLLSWLIDPETETVYIYQGQTQSVHNGFDKPVSGEPVLPGFELILSELRML